MLTGICVTLTASRKDYAKAITWLSDLLHGTTFDLERVKNLVHRKLADLPEAKENGAEIAEAAVSSLLFCETRLAFGLQRFSISQADPLLLG